MKFSVKTFLLSCLCACLMSPVYSMANNCPDKRSKLKEMTIMVQKITVEHNALIMYYKHKGKSDSMMVSYGHKDTYEKYLGKTVKLQYRDEQYFDEHDGECVTRKSVSKIGKSNVAD